MRRYTRTLDDPLMKRLARGNCIVCDKELINNDLDYNMPENQLKELWWEGTIVTICKYHIKYTTRKEI
jgi:hypothetical protein